MDSESLTTHEQMLLRIDGAISEAESLGSVLQGIRADTIANGMDGVNGRSAAVYYNLIRDLEQTGDVADLSRLRLTERGELRVREIRARQDPAPRAAPTEHTRVFLLMPFDSDFNWLRDEIVAAGLDAGVAVERGDDIFSGGVIIEQVKERIHSAAAIIAVCTGRNANVFYELGIAERDHRPILVAESKKDLPFDVHHFRAHFYGGGKPGSDRSTLRARIGAAITETIANRIPKGTRVTTVRGASVPRLDARV
jgi:hypothetical protein